MSDGRVPAYLLAGGLVLVIPAVVVMLDQTRYMPTEGAREDRPVTNTPPAEPGKPGGGAVLGTPPATGPTPAATPSATPPGGTPPPTTPPATPPGGGGGGAQAPLSLLDVQVTPRSGPSRGAAADLRMGLPVPEVRQALSAAEQKKFGVENNAAEVRFPVFHLTF